jgi:hypothetical protein
MKKTIITVLATVAVLSFATVAYAQPSVDGYSDEAGQIQTQVDPSGGGGTPPSGTVTPTSATPTSATASDSGGSLPFTGLDVALLVGAGGLLVAAGFGMRRLTRAPDAAA